MTTSSVYRGTLANISRRNGRMLYLGTISDQRTESQHKSRNIDGAQPEDQLHGVGSRTNASKRPVNIKSLVGRRKIS